MINLTVSNTTKREDIIVNGSTTVKECFEKAGIDCSRGLISLDGSRVKDLNASIESLGAVNGSSLMSIIKNDNARA